MDGTVKNKISLSTPSSKPSDEIQFRLNGELESIRPLLRRSAQSVLRRNEDVEDAVQEALLRLMKNATSFDPRRGSLQTLGRTTVRRIALDMLARKSPIASSDTLDPVAPEEKHPLEAEQIKGRLRLAVDALPDPQRVAFLLVHQEGLSHEKAARELGVSSESLRARLYRARCQLRVALKDLAP